MIYGGKPDTIQLYGSKRFQTKKTGEYPTYLFSLQREDVWHLYLILKQMDF